MWQLLFSLIFISIAIFIIIPLFQDKSLPENRKDDIKDYNHNYEILENEYNLGLIDQKQFEREKEKLKK